MTNIYNINFINAINDYYYLINKEYSKRVVLKIVSDRYKLNHDQRTIIYRGILNEKIVSNIKPRLIEENYFDILTIDGFNVLLRIFHYLLGRPLFVSNDGLLRDAGRWDEKFTDNIVFKNALMLFLKNLNIINVQEIYVYFDYKFNSKNVYLKNIILNLLENFEGFNKKVNFIWSDNVDREIKLNSRGVLATSDCEVLISNNAKIFDLARMILEKKFNAEFINIIKFIDKQ